MVSFLWLSSIFVILCSFLGWRAPFILAGKLLKAIGAGLFLIMFYGAFFAIVYGVGGPFALGGCILLVAMVWAICVAADIANFFAG